MNQQETNKKKITGVLGLGAMGSGIAHNLFKHNQLATVYNRTTKKSEQFQKNTQVPYKKSLSEFAAQCNVIITSLSTDSDVLEIIKSLLPNIQAGTIIIDTSTIGVDTVSKCNVLLAGKNSFFLDAPVSGGSEGANNGQLVMMVGGDENILNSVTDILSCFTKSISYMGKAGNGQITKAVNQIMAAGINQAVTEALAFAKATGLATDKLIDTLSGGAAGNWFLDHRGKSMLCGDYQPGFKVKLHHKDLLLCNKMIEDLGENRLPIVEMTLIHYQRLIDQGYGDEDISALFRSKQTLLKN
ncbi:MAG: NAD(P)-dependent oxidoreductase [Thiohalomonadales bacterium]